MSNNLNDEELNKVAGGYDTKEEDDKVSEHVGNSVGQYYVYEGNKYVFRRDTSNGGYPGAKSVTHYFIATAVRVYEKSNGCGGTTRTADYIKENGEEGSIAINYGNVFEYVE